MKIFKFYLLKKVIYLILQCLSQTTNGLIDISKFTINLL